MSFETDIDLDEDTVHVSFAMRHIGSDEGTPPFCLNIDFVDYDKGADQNITSVDLAELLGEHVDELGCDSKHAKQLTRLRDELKQLTKKADEALLNYDE